MFHADDALPRVLAAKNRGLNWHATLNCRGIQHFCATAIKLGGRYHDLVEPNFTLGNKKFSWLYVVECKATHTSNAAGSNVLRELEYLQPPTTTCAAEHERARQYVNKADMQYSKTRPADRKQIKQQAVLHGRFNSGAVVNAARNAIHDVRLNIGPAVMVQQKAQSIAKEVKAELFGVDGRSSSAVTTEVAEYHQQALQDWVEKRHMSPARYANITVCGCWYAVPCCTLFAPLASFRLVNCVQSVHRHNVRLCCTLKSMLNCRKERACSPPFKVLGCLS